MIEVGLVPEHAFVVVQFASVFHVDMQVINGRNKIVEGE